MFLLFHLCNDSRAELFKTHNDVNFKRNRRKNLSFLPKKMSEDFALTIFLAKLITVIDYISTKNLTNSGLTTSLR